MPPRAAARGAAAKAPIRGGRGGKQVKPRGRGGKQKSSRRPSTVEEFIPEPELPPPKLLTWFDKIPPLPVKPDEELHKKLSAERKLKHAQKVERYCKEELDSMFKFAMNVSEIFLNPNEAEYKEIRRQRIDFRKGVFIPDEESKEETTKRNIEPIILEPKHSIDILNYLHMAKQPYYSNLANLFETKITEDYISDPNKTFSELIEKIQAQSLEFPEKYEPEKPVLPYVFCVIGPPAGGTTTICQLLMNTYSCAVIEAVYMPPPDTSRRRKGESETPPPESKLDYHLQDAIVVYYSDDKNAVQQISTVVKDIDRTTKGIIISGYPNTKQQLSALEKALAGNTVGRPNSSRSAEKQKAAQCVITGFILGMNCPEVYETRYIDPLTGYVYSEKFHRPGAADLVGKSLPEFLKSKLEIEHRLVENSIGDQSQITQKQLSSWNTLTNSLKKNYSVLVVENLENSLELVKRLDSFVSQIMHDENVHFAESLLVPTYLTLPGACNEAIHVWRKCLDIFGRQIADQNRLVTTIADKIGDLTETATSRFHLMTALKIGDTQKLEKGDLNMVWNESIENRNANVKTAASVISKSGLLELAIALINAPRFAFICLVEKMAYVKWFTETFAKLFENPEEFYDVFREKSQLTQLVTFNFKSHASRHGSFILPPDFHLKQLPQKPLKAPEKAEREKEISQRGILYAAEFFDLNSFTCESPAFNSSMACSSLGIPLFSTSTPFSEIEKYSNEFLDFVKQNTTTQVLIDECTAFAEIFGRINKFVKPLEVSIVTSLFNLHDSFINYAFNKFTHEMEGFCTNGQFKYDFSLVNEKDLQMCIDVNMLETTDVRKIIPDSVLTHMRLNIGILHGVTTDDVLSLFKVFEGGKYQKFLRICLNIMECGECMDISKFLDLFE